MELNTEAYIMAKALIKEIRDAQCWHDMIIACDALQAVRMRESSMVDEYYIHNPKPEPLGSVECRTPLKDKEREGYGKNRLYKNKK